MKGIYIFENLKSRQLTSSQLSSYVMLKQGTAVHLASPQLDWSTLEMVISIKELIGV